MIVKTWPRAIPTGDCWCGCGAEVPIGSFFAQGHDKVAESAVVICDYGSVADLLLAHGYGPGGKNARAELQQHRERGKS
jgi:hypothetical protein